MANYKELEGFSVQTLATDPDSPGWIGSIFYNSTEGVFKTVKPGGASIGTWASGGSLNTVRGSHAGFGVSKDSALSAGGAQGPTGTPPAGGATETYNGTSWTEENDLITAVQVSGSFGTQTAGIFATGSGAPNSPVLNVQQWDGSNWSEIGEVNTARRQSKGAGTTTAGIIVGGYLGPGPVNAWTGATESWNGSSWTELSDLNTIRAAGGSSSSSPNSDMIYFAGQNPAVGNELSLTEIWNGTSWTETTDMNTARNNIGSSGVSSNSALAFFGQPPPTQTAITESWNGTSWTEVADGATPRAYVGSNGSSGSAQINGGEKSGASPYYRGETEEWNAPDVLINTLTTS
jgi:hypothetical protein